MPNCLQLTRKSDPEAGPVSLNVIDRELCALVGLEEHPTRYCLGWFDVIGFSLACDKTFAGIRAELTDGTWHDPDGLLLQMCDYLDANFSPDAWAEVGRAR